MRLIISSVWFLLVDIPIVMLKLLVTLTGPVVVALALPFASTRNGVKRLPKCVSWWGNPTYGTYGNNSYQTKKAYNPFFVRNSKGFMSQWYWLVIRNPGNGLVEVPLFSFRQVDADIKHWGKDHIDNGIYGWQFLSAKNGWRRYTGFYAMVPYCPWFDFECRIGFKILPTEPNRTRRTGMTFIINPFKRAARR